MTDRPATGLQAEASNLAALVAIVLFLGCLMVALPLLHRVLS